MVNEQLYRFIKLKSKDVPVAIIRNSLIRHGYRRMDVDEAVRQVILEQKEHAREEEKKDVFQKFGGRADEDDMHTLRTSGAPSPLEKEFVTLDSLKKPEPKKNVFQDIASTFRLNKKQEAKPAPVKKAFSKRVPEPEHKPDGFVDVDALKKEAERKVRLEQEEETLKRIAEIRKEEHQPEAVEQEVEEPVREEVVEEVPAEVKTVEKIKESKPVKAKVKKPAKVKFKIPLIIKVRAFYNTFIRGWREVDPIKLSYFALAVLSVLGIALSLIFIRTKLYMFTIRFILGSSVILMLAHNLRHLEKKYDLDHSEKNAFELSVTIGIAGWVLSMLLNPLYMLILFLPGSFFFAILVKDVYHTSLKIAVKVSALTAVAGFFAFYGVAIILGVLVSLRVLV